MTNDELLHKWINGELTPTERKIFEQRPEYDSLVELYKNTENYAAPDFDESAMLAQILKQPKSQQKNNTKARSVSIFKWQYFAAAAAISLLIGLFFWYQPSSKELYATAQGEILEGTLPDGSTFVLNAASTITYDSKNWDSGRQLHLEGEAFFKVQKGKRFRVATPAGMVQVLGTEFNVKARRKTMEVSCQEGKVAVLNFVGNTLQELSPQEAVRIDDQKIVEQWQIGANENWTDGIYRFKKNSVAEILAEIERQFDIQMITQGINTSEIISCNFQRDNLELALKTCLIPAGIQYKIDGNKVTLSSN